MRSKLQKKPSSNKREHSALQNIKLLHFFYFWVIFALLDLDPDLLDKKSMQIQICNTIYKIFSSFFTLNVSVADPDPGSGIGCLFDPWIRDPGSGMGESQHPDPGSGMNNPDHIF
jgi:hypothetical protein